MGWLLLLSGVAVNITGVIVIKFAQHLDKGLISLLGYFFYFGGFIVLSLSFRRLDVGMAYAIWSGIGSVLALGFGVAFFGESLSLSKMGFFMLIMVGVIGMSLTT